MWYNAINRRDLVFHQIILRDTTLYENLKINKIC
jgi:hypothetical protein